MNTDELLSRYRQEDDSGLLSRVVINDEISGLFLNEISKLKHLKELEIRLVEVNAIPREIGLLTNIERLTLWGKSITNIPVEIGLLRNLTDIRIVNTSIVKLPEEIGNLNNLRILYIIKNNLTELPKSIGKLSNLRSLHLEDNPFASLPEDIGMLTNLQALVLGSKELVEFGNDLDRIIKIKNHHPSEYYFKLIPQSIESELFKNDKSLKQVIIPEGIRRIDREAFKGCSSLEKVTFPDSLDWIRLRAFENCANLEEVLFSGNDHWVEIAPGAFAGCKSLKSITLPYGVTAIHKETFKNCTSLIEIIIPDSVVFIEENAFENCSNLRRISLPWIMDKLEKSILSGSCPADEVIYTKNPEYRLEGNLLFPKDGYKLMKYFYTDQEFIVPDNITKIANFAFRDYYFDHHSQYLTNGETISHPLHPSIPNHKLIKLIIPSHVKEISEEAFTYMDQVEHIQVDEKLVKRDFNFFWRNLQRFEVLNEEKKVIGIFDCSYGKAKKGFEFADEDKKVMGLFWIELDRKVNSKKIIGSPEEYDQWLFDSLFTEVDPVYNDKKLEIALNRLKFPYDLSSPAKERYTEYLKAHKKTWIPTLIEKNDFETLTTFADILFTRNNIDEIINLANISKNTEMVAFLLDYKQKNFGINPEQNKKMEIKIPKQLEPGSNEYTKKYFSFTGFKEGNLTVQGYKGPDKCITLPTEVDGKPVTGFNPRKSFGIAEDIIIPEGYCEINSGVNNLSFLHYYVYKGNLKKLSIADSVTIIQPFIFAKIGTLEEVQIGQGIREISEGMFYMCSSLTSVVIPQGVTEIGSQAFEGCTSLTSVVIPEGVTEIGCYAFSGCTSLISVVIPQGVKEIEHSAFSGCTSLTSVVIPQGVKEIGRSAFSGCTSLSSIVIPQGVTEIGHDAFNGCSSLNSVVIPEGVTKIGWDAFSGCTSLISVVIPKGVTEVGSSAFSNCASLTSVVIPEEAPWLNYGLFEKTPFLENLPGDLKSVGRYLLLYTGNEKEVVIPNTISKICYQAFHGNANLVSVVISEGLNEIGSQAFSGCTSLTSIVIPQGVKVIGHSAFSGCTSLSSIVIPQGVTEIGHDVFNGCSSLNSVVIPEGVTKIGWDAFSGCTSLTSIVLPQGVRWIGGESFSRCTSLTSIVIPQGVKEIEHSAFSGCTSLNSVRFNIGLTRIGKEAFKGCPLSEIDLPNSIKEIGQDAFKLSASISEVNVVYYHSDTPGEERLGLFGLIINLLDQNRTRIAKLLCLDLIDFLEYDRFFGKLLCGGVNHLSEYDKLFSTCNTSSVQKGKLAALRLAFPYELDEKFKQEYQDYLKKNGRFIVPSIIDEGDIETLTIMASCGALSEKRIQEYIDQANKNQKTELWAFLMDYKNKHFALTKDLNLQIKPAKLADSWVSRNNEDDTLTITKYRGKDLAVEIPAMIGDKKVSKIGLGQPLRSLFYDHPKIQGVKILEGIQKINDGAFIGCYQIQSVEIPKSVEIIGSNAFSGCINLTSVVIPKGVTEIGHEAFSGCTSLTSVVIPKGVTEIGSDAFSDCTSLTSVVIPEGVKEIGYHVFIRCTSLTSVIIPQGVTEIGGSAFYGCTSLTSVVIPQGVTEIGSYAFFGCTSLTSVVIPEKGTVIKIGAFSGCTSLTIHAPKGSYAIEYAKKQNIKYEELT